MYQQSEAFRVSRRAQAPQYVALCDKEPKFAAFLSGLAPDTEVLGLAETPLLDAFAAELVALEWTVVFGQPTSQVAFLVKKRWWKGARLGRHVVEGDVSLWPAVHAATKERCKQPKQEPIFCREVSGTGGAVSVDDLVALYDLDKGKGPAVCRLAK